MKKTTSRFGSVEAGPPRLYAAVMDWLPIDLIAANSSFGIAGDLLERTASTVRVQRIVELSLAPVFLIAGIGAMLNVMNSRLTWIVDRIRRMERALDNPEASARRRKEAEELPVLRKRQRLAHMAIDLSTAGALAICLVIATLFVSAFIRTSIGTLVALLWIAAMALIFAGLLYFLMETRLATRSARETRKLARRMIRKGQDAE
ncbi:MAG: DUF2721 domain-containing protein [Sphingomonadales bacterium]|nr:DUF2721 domain-containing protein [Sphingomonadales bacterium]